MVEVMVDGQFSYAGTDNFSLAAVEEITKLAVFRAKSASKIGVFPYSVAMRPQVMGKYKSPREIDLDQLSLEELTSRLVNSTKIIKNKKNILSASADASIVECEIHYITSSGTDISQSFYIVGNDISATAKKDSEVQTRSLGREGLQQGLERFSSERLLEDADRISNEALELLNAKECPTGSMDLLLHPDQMILQIHESIGHPLELDRILGDERNYAGFSFINKEDFGNLKYGTDLLNITFDPTLDGEMASYKFDDSGMPARKEFIIKDGVLERGLGSLESQARLEVGGVANSRSSSWNRAPIDRMANLNMETGESSLDDMLKNMEYGVVMSTNKSWSIDDYRNKFQFGCEYGKLVKDGKVVETVKNPNYRGVTIPFWNNLNMVGDAATFDIKGTPYCGKGEPNQVIRVGHATPSCLFKNIEVFGGA
jgi:predicted Zn-dependent protease